jgi:hypothetical protein
MLGVFDGRAQTSEVTKQEQRAVRAHRRQRDRQRSKRRSREREELGSKRDREASGGARETKKQAARQTREAREAKEAKGQDKRTDLADRGDLGRAELLGPRHKILKFNLTCVRAL